MGAAGFGSEQMRVGVLGGPGTFAWLAFRRLAEACQWSYEVRYFASVEQLLTGLLKGQVDAACVAIQTSPGGFTPIVVEVLRHPSLAPIAETVLPFDCTLYVRDGYGLQQVRLVLGHHSLELARNWLQRHLPEARLEVRASTLEAAQEVRQSRGDRAVVGSPVLREFVPGLAVAARGIDEGAVARWWALASRHLENVAGTRALIVGHSVSAAEVSTFIADSVRSGLQVEAMYFGAARGPDFRCDTLLLVEGGPSALRGMRDELMAKGGPFHFRATYRVVRH